MVPGKSCKQQRAVEKYHITAHGRVLPRKPNIDQFWMDHIEEEKIRRGEIHPLLVYSLCMLEG